MCYYRGIIVFENCWSLVLEDLICSEAVMCNV